MKNKNLFTLFTIFLVFLSFILLSGCQEIDDGSIEYKATDLAYDDGDDCFERYLLYENEGTYERYIGGTYKGNYLPGLVFGTLFETGKYTVDSTQTPATIKFSPKKQYDFNTGTLINLGTAGQVPYYGKLTEEKLTITWQVWSPFSEDYGEVDYEYERN